ncbi:Annexin D4 [Acorus calamus]|uniref:Annexin D4 n=1 Tax=Acorus calamus TaxID=4465 RepID=A0AAV9EV26_ACOCL|nr:Annexin D4 [Acorus calamus]
MIIGFGVEEGSMISIMGKWRPEHHHSFRRSVARLFKVDDHHRAFERWDDDHIKLLEAEFSRFKNAVVLRATHPWERDARMAHHVINKGHPLNILVEIACTRSSEDLLGARKAYQSLFASSLEEDVAFHLQGDQRNLLVGLVSTYRYEGPHMDDKVAEAEAKVLTHAIKNAASHHPLHSREVLRILTTRSRLHLIAVCKHYEQLNGKSILEDAGVESGLLETIECLCDPPKYFTSVIEGALKEGADEHAKEGLTRVVVTQADFDMKEIKEEYHRRHSVVIEEDIKKSVRGNYRDFLLTLVARG